MLFACQTAELFTGGARATPTRKPVAQSSAPKKTTPPEQHTGFEFTPLGTPRCGVGDNNASVVIGHITENGAPVVGQRVTASSGPGAEPISENPAVTDERGRYQVTFVCDGKACDGAFWIWTVNDQLEQTSPFVQFIFENNCRRGALDFQKQ